jgi:hypothetical protein
MGDEGAIRMAKGLEENTSLKGLDFEGAFLLFFLHSFLHVSLLYH